jgi:hypothetical protein
VYLATARDHPPAVTKRQQQHDLARLVHAMRDLNERQARLFLTVGAELARYRAPELQPLLDQDVAEAARALAATFETSARGVIYDHRAASLPAERLAAALRPMLAEAGRGGGTQFERDAAVVLRRIEETVQELAADGQEASPFLALVGRMLRRPEGGDASGSGVSSSEPRLIVP